MGKKYYLAHVRGGTLLRGQEQAVTCGESKQEPSKAGLLPTAEIAVPLTGKSACRGPCPSPPFLCRQSSHHCPFSPAKLCLCSLGSRSRWLLFPRLRFTSLTVSSLPPCSSGPVLVELRILKNFLKSVVRKFPCRQGDHEKGIEGLSALKISYRLFQTVEAWQLGQYISMLLLEEGHLPPCSLLPHTLFSPSSASMYMDPPFLLHQLQLSSVPLARTCAIRSLNFISVSYLALHLDRTACTGSGPKLGDGEKNGPHGFLLYTQD